MKASTHKNNLKISKKTIRDGSLQIKSKQQTMNKKDLMIKAAAPVKRLNQYLKANQQNPKHTSLLISNHG